MTDYKVLPWGASPSATSMIRSNLAFIKAAVHGRSIGRGPRHPSISPHQGADAQGQRGRFQSCQVWSARRRRAAGYRSLADARAAVHQRMIILDTNVLSELMASHAGKGVGTMARQSARSKRFISAITEAELRDGVALLPAGKRRVCPYGDDRGHAF